MKTIAKVLSLIAVCSLSVLGQTDPCTQNTKLSNGTDLSMNGNQGTGSLSGTDYHYEAWIEGGNSSDQQLKWYGANQGGGAAFYAKWKDPNDYLARVGYYWGGSNGPVFSTLNHVYMDFNYTRSGNNTAGDYSYIGVYGWARNPNASTSSERLIEYYVVEDWFGNQYQNESSPVNGNTIMSDQTNKNHFETITVDGSTYKLYKKTRTGHSVDGDNVTFTQIFSVRDNQRKCGTIYVNDHVKKWEELGALRFERMYDLKFLAEAGGGEGWFDLSYLKISREDQPRGSAPPGSSSSSARSSSSLANSSSSSSSSSGGSEVCGEYQTSFCGGMAYAEVPHNSTAIPSTGSCLFIGDFETIQPALNSTVSINGEENACGDDWDDCPYNEKREKKDGGYYVYVKTGTINEYENNGWKDIVAGTKPDCQPTPIFNKVPLTHFSVRASGKALLVEASSPATVEVYNLRGRKAATFNVLGGSQTVNLSLPGGVYFAKVRGTSKQYIRFVWR